MSTDEQLKIVIQTLQEEIKHSHELNNEVNKQKGIKTDIKDIYF